ncbi:MAG TPA: tetratricopeptide repeat protein [Dehalococcoidia bacterium]|jgi:tetratricopeptide (TPR) repeat protein|nr:tetratricopeptide repeat protein [Dehalococcoidia bacterium]
MIKTRPNEPCPCGSGRKYKRCCAPGQQLKRAGRLNPEQRSDPGRSTLAGATVIVSAIAAVVALVVYSGTLDAPFLYDDITYVQENPLVAEGGSLGKVWTTSYPPGREAAGLYRPVTSTTYFIDRSLWGLEPARFHLTNVMLHAAATFLFVVLVSRLGLSTAGALAAGLIFAVHAVHVEAVSWVIGRAEVIAGLAGFAAVLAWVAYRRTRRVSWLGAAAAWYFVGLGAKETIAPLPAVLLFGEYLGIFSEPDASGRSERWRGASLRAYVAIAAAFGLYAVLRVSALGRFGMAVGGTAFVGDSSATRMSSGLAVIGEYVRLTLAPLRLRVDYSDFKFDGLSEPRVLIGMAVAASVIIGTVALRHRARHVSFWLAWFALFIFPFSNLFIQIGTVLAERFLYIASAGACALAGIAFGHAWKERNALRRAVAASGLAVIVMWLGHATVTRSQDWHDPVTFWRAEIERSPGSEKAQVNLAGALWQEGNKKGDEKLKEESDHLLRAGIATHRAGGDPLTTDYVWLLYSYASHLSERGRPAEAIQYYETPYDHLDSPVFDIRLRPDYLAQYGAALEATGHLDKAATVYEKALQLRPGWGGIMMNLGNILGRQGHPEEAVAQYRKAIASEPKEARTYVNLGLTLLQLNRREEAISILDQAARVTNDTAESAWLQGMLAARIGLKDRALERYRHALALDPGNTAARKALEDLR